MKNSILFLCLLAAGPVRARQGTYTFPAPVELQPFATWPLAQLEIKKEPSHLKIRYQLPPKLVGSQIEVFEMSGKTVVNSLWIEVTGERVRGQCLEKARGYTCLVKFENTQVETQQLSEKLDSLGIAGQEKHNRLQVAHFFSGEPHGVIEIKD